MIEALTIRNILRGNFPKRKLSEKLKANFNKHPLATVPSVLRIRIRKNPLFSRIRNRVF
jgi:hypothetical protein